MRVHHQLGRDLRAKVRDMTRAHRRLVAGELDVLKVEAIAFMKGVKSEIRGEC